MNISLEKLLEQVVAFLPQAAGAAFILLVFWFVGLIVSRVFKRLALKSDPGRQDILRLFARACRLTLIVFGVVSALGTLGINVAAMVAGLGLTGFALSFALKDVLSNAVSGVLLLFYQPFQRGDQVVAEGFEGEVMAIDLRYTRLQVKSDTVLIPNSVLFTKSVRVLDSENG